MTFSTVALGVPGGPAAWPLLWVMWLATLNTTAVINNKRERQVGERQNNEMPNSSLYKIQNKALVCLQT